MIGRGFAEKAGAQQACDVASKQVAGRQVGNAPSAPTPTIFGGVSSQLDELASRLYQLQHQLIVNHDRLNASLGRAFGSNAFDRPPQDPSEANAATGGLPALMRIGGQISALSNAIDLLASEAACGTSLANAWEQLA